MPFSSEEQKQWVINQIEALQGIGSLQELSVFVDDAQKSIQNLKFSQDSERAEFLSGDQFEGFRNDLQQKLQSFPEYVSSEAKTKIERLRDGYIEGEIVPYWNNGVFVGIGSTKDLKRCNGDIRFLADTGEDKFTELLDNNGKNIKDSLKDLNGGEDELASKFLSKNFQRPNAKGFDYILQQSYSSFLRNQVLSKINLPGKLEADVTINPDSSILLTYKPDGTCKQYVFSNYVTNAIKLINGEEIDTSNTNNRSIDLEGLVNRISGKTSSDIDNAVEELITENPNIIGYSTTNGELKQFGDIKKVQESIMRALPQELQSKIKEYDDWPRDLQDYIQAEESKCKPDLCRQTAVIEALGKIDTNDKLAALEFIYHPMEACNKNKSLLLNQTFLSALQGYFGRVEASHVYQYINTVNAQQQVSDLYKCMSVIKNVFQDVLNFNASFKIRGRYIPLMSEFKLLSNVFFYVICVTCFLPRIMGAVLNKAPRIFKPIATLLGVISYGALYMLVSKKAMSKFGAQEGSGLKGFLKQGASASRITPKVENVGPNPLSSDRVEDRQPETKGKKESPDPTSAESTQKLPTPTNNKPRVGSM